MIPFPAQPPDIDIEASLGKFKAEKQTKQRTAVILCWIYVTFLLSCLAFSRLIMQDIVQAFDEKHLMTLILETLAIFKSNNKTLT